MSRTKRNDEANDGKIASNACFIKTDGDVVKYEKTESNDPAFYNPSFKKELKKKASRKVRMTAKENLGSEANEE